MVYGFLAKTSALLSGLFISILQFHVSNGTNPKIAQWHRSREVDCGIKPPRPFMHGKGRISNSVPSKERYPWAILVIRTETKVGAGSEGMQCGGTIISKNVALTAGHCVCGPIDKIGVHCSPGRHTDQIHQNNVIETRIFDNDNWDYVRLAPIESAYVLYNKLRTEKAFNCMHYPNSCKVRPKESDWHDLGLILPTKNKNFKDFRDFVVPLCLPDGSSKIPKEYDNGEDAIINFVGWGKQYSEYPSGSSIQWNQDLRAPTESSCTTNQFGVYTDTTAEKTKFKRCQIEFLRDNVVKKGWKGCKKCHKSGCLVDDLPKNYDPDECSSDWEQAKNAVKKTGNHEMIRKFNNEAKKIKIVDRSRPASRSRECLKEDLFIDHGWCKVQGDDTWIAEVDWGICDWSCDHVESYYSDKGDNGPVDKYNIFQWKIGENTKASCHGDVSMLPGFQACIRTLHKIVKVWTFYQDGPNSFRIKDPLQEEEIYPADKPGWQHTCLGDSGGGHWMKEGGSGTRQVLVGVTTGGTFVCGVRSYMEKLNHDETLKWIKEIMDLHPCFIYI